MDIHHVFHAQTEWNFWTWDDVKYWNCGGGWVVTTHMGQKIYSDGGAEPNKKFDDIFNCVDQIQRDGRTDKRQQRRPRLRIASRG